MTNDTQPDSTPVGGGKLSERTAAYGPARLSSQNERDTAVCPNISIPHHVDSAGPSMARGSVTPRRNARLPRPGGVTVVAPGSAAASATTIISIRPLARFRTVGARSAHLLSLGGCADPDRIVAP